MSEIQQNIFIFMLFGLAVLNLVAWVFLIKILEIIRDHIGLR